MANTCEAGQAQRELRSPDASELRDAAKVEQRKRGGDDDRRQPRFGQVSADPARLDKNHAHQGRSNETRCLCAYAGRLCDRGARRARADRKALKQPRAGVHHPKCDQLLILIDVLVDACGIAA